MRKIYRGLLCSALLALVMVGSSAQELDPAKLLQPATDSWPSYAGDYSQKRFSPLKQINQGNVKNLALQWVGTLPAGMGGPGGGPGGGGGFGPAAPAVVTIVGGEAKDALATSGAASMGGAILQVNGILYMSAPDNAWAMDARTGNVLWHYFWKTKGGTHIGNRGMAMYGDWLYFETPDDYLVSLEAKTGKERWHKVISDFNQQYFSTMAPIVVGNHLLVGTSDDIDAPGFLQSFDPTTGDLQWKHYNVPMEKGDPGLETWASLDAARHGGAQAWIPGSYDPEQHLYIYPTGNPTPAYSVVTRGDLDNLYTACVIAVDVDTGKMKWYFQTSPRDTHDWDSTQAPVLADITIDGRPRKVVMQAARNGYFFVIDRVTGEHIVTGRFAPATNWAKGLTEKGAPRRDPGKDATFAGSLVSPDNPGSTNWPSPSFDPDTGLFYVSTKENFSMYYLTETDPRVIAGLGGKEEDGVGGLGASLVAMDPKTGKIAWRRHLEGGAAGSGGFEGLLTTAGGLLFGTESTHFVAYDPKNGNVLWHSKMGGVRNAPETYMLDGKQYVIVSGGSTIWAYALN